MFEGIRFLWHVKRLSSGDSSTRREAAKGLGELGDVRAVEPLIVALKDSDRFVRQTAAVALGRLKDGRAVEPLIAAIKDVDKNVKLLAAQVLAVLGDSRAVDPLIVLLEETDEEPQAAAARALGQLGDQRAAGPLSKALHHRDPKVVSAAADALVQLGSGVVDTVVVLLGHWNMSARFSAAKVLERIGWVPADSASRIQFAIAKGDFNACVQEGLAAIDPLLAEFSKSVGERLSITEGTRSRIAKALGELGDARAIEPLIGALRDSNHYDRAAAVEALVQIGDDRAVGPLTAALKDGDTVMRQTATEALKKWKSPAPLTRVNIAIAIRYFGDCVAEGVVAVEPLIAAFKTEQDETIRNAVATTLVQLGSVSVEPLLAALQDSHKFVREMAAEALGELKDARSVGLLIGMINNADEYTRATAADVLGRIGDAQAVEPLIAALKQSSKLIRWGAAEALGRLKDMRAVDPLLAALKDSDGDVQRQAAIALTRLGDQRGIDVLIQGLQIESLSDWRTLSKGTRQSLEALCAVGWVPPDALSRVRIAISLRRFGDCVQEGAVAADPLIALLRDGGINNKDKVEVIRALAHLGSPSVEPLIALLGNTDGRLVQHAADALGQLGDARAVRPLKSLLVEYGRDYHGESLRFPKKEYVPPFVLWDNRRDVALAMRDALLKLVVSGLTNASTSDLRDVSRLPDSLWVSLYHYDNSRREILRLNDGAPKLDISNLTHPVRHELIRRGEKV